MAQACLRRDRSQRESVVGLGLTQNFQQDALARSEPVERCGKWFHLAGPGRNIADCCGSFCKLWDAWRRLFKTLIDDEHKAPPLSTGKVPDNKVAIGNVLHQRCSRGAMILLRYIADVIRVIGMKRQIYRCDTLYLAVCVPQPGPGRGLLLEFIQRAIAKNCPGRAR